MNILLHKIMIVILKFIPIILSLIYLIGTISSILGKSTIVLSYLGFVSFLPGLFILLSSFVFKFCLWHRLPLYFILSDNIFNWIVWQVYGEIQNTTFVLLTLILAGIFIVLGVYFKYKNDKQSRIIKNMLAEHSK
jgi:hypothetical protein